MKRILGSSPSFVITVVVLAALLGGYLVWRFGQTNEVRESDWVVRRFYDDISARANDLRRRGREVVHRARAGGDREAAARQIAVLESAALDDVNRRAEAAENEIDALERISLRTRRNRLSRIDRRLEETRAFIAETAAQLQQRLLRAGPQEDEP